MLILHQLLYWNGFRWVVLRTCTPRLQCCRPAKVLWRLRRRRRHRGEVVRRRLQGGKATATEELKTVKRDDKGSVFRSGPTDPDTRESLWTDSNTAEENTAGGTERWCEIKMIRNINVLVYETFFFQFMLARVHFRNLYCKSGCSVLVCHFDSLSAALFSTMRALSTRTTDMGMDCTAGPQATSSPASSTSTERKVTDNSCSLMEPPFR